MEAGWSMETRIVITFVDASNLYPVSTVVAVVSG